MKIIVMDSTNVRIEILNVADHMLEDEIELFLCEHGYSLNNISWIAAPIDFVPVQFHDMTPTRRTARRFIPHAAHG